MLHQTALPLAPYRRASAGAFQSAAQAARKTVILRSAQFAMAGFNIKFPKLWCRPPTQRLRP